MTRVVFRAETDGYAFTNHWTFDDYERQLLEQTVAQLLPVAEAAASPIYLPLIMPFLIAEFAAAGPFAPLLIDAEVNAINQSILNGIDGAIATMSYGLCGGMAFSSLDYWLRQWIVPRGTGVDDQPSRATPQGTTLRNYIWGRLLDSVRDNAAQFLTWMYIGQLPFGVGGAWLKDQTRDQFQTIKSGIDAGTPVPLGLIGTTWNPLDNHQVLCYGYDDNMDDTGSLYLYDNNHPGTESRIDFDLRGGVLSTSRDNTAQDARGPLRAFFATTYSAHTPPVAVVLNRSLTASPGCVQAMEPFTASYSVLNVGYHQSPAMELQVMEGASPAGGETAPTSLAEGAARAVNAQVTLDTPGWQTLSVLADLGVAGAVPAHIVKQIPPADTSEVGTLQVNALPPLRIRVQPPVASAPCGAFATMEAGATATFALASSPPVPPGGAYQWSVQGGAGLGASNGSTFQAQMPSPAGASITVSAVITYGDGCRRSGTYTLQSESHLIALVESAFCSMQGSLHTIFHVPGQIPPKERPRTPFPIGELLTRDSVVKLHGAAQQWARDLDAALAAGSGAPIAPEPATPMVASAPRAAAGNESTVIMSLGSGQARGMLRTPSGLTFPIVAERAEVGRGITNTEEAAAIDLTPEQDKLTVSRIHAMIQRSGDQFEIEDLRSANGTTLNGQKLAPGQRYPLKNGDVIEFGKVRCIFISG